MRNLGVDLHSNNFVVCYRTADGEQSLAKYRLSQIEQFQASLHKDDRLAVEASATSRWFTNQIKDLVDSVVVVNPRKFEVIAKSVKKTDVIDARALAEFLSFDLLPATRQKSEAEAEVQSLCSVRAGLVEIRSKLFNQMHALVIAAGRQETKRSVKSALGRRRLLAGEWSEIERIELEILSRQIESLDSGIGELEAAVEKAGEKLSGYQNLRSIKGIGSQSAALFSAVIGNVSEFASEKKLAAYFGVVPSVKNSNQRERRGRITKQGNKAARTALLQCALVAKKFSPFLQEFYRKIKERRGAGKANIALARKFLSVIYHTLKNNWVFTDFPNFVKAET